MADYSISLTIDEADEAEVVAALNWHYGKFKDGETYRDRTSGEIKTKLKADKVAELKAIHKRHQKYLAAQAEQNAADANIT